MIGSKTIIRGEAVSLLASSKLLNANLMVFKPLADCFAFDLVLLAGGAFYKAQLKRAYKSTTEGKYQVSLRTINLKPSGYVTKTYSELDADFIIAVIFETNDVYCIPMSLVAGRKGITLNPNNIVCNITNKKALSLEKYKNTITINSVTYSL